MTCSGGSITDFLANTRPNCEVCLGTGMVCENHPKRPWDGYSTAADACGCGAGMPCVCTGASPLLAGDPE